MENQLTSQAQGLVGKQVGDSRESEIGRELQRQSNVVGEIDGMTQELEKRLGNVLRQEPPQEEKDLEKPEITTELGTALSNQTDQLHDVAHRLSSIFQRIEL